MADNRIAYGIAEGMGINTDGMKPKAVWQAIADKQGVSVEQAMQRAYRGVMVKQLKTVLERKRKSELTTLLGEEFKGYKGQDAVNKLLQEKRGHIKGAFHRDDMGDIDLLWGSDTVGLKHILQRREEQGINAEEFVSNLAEVVEKSEFKKRNDRGNFELEHNGKVIIISPEYHGNKITYLLTSYKTRIKKKPPQ